MKYEINKPDSELTEGYFTLFLKYLTLFLVGWFGGWLFLLFYKSPRISLKSRNDFSNLLINNPGVTSIVVGLGVLYFFAQRAYKKSKLGLMTKIEFDDNNSIVILGLLNTMSGAYKERKINIKDIKTILELKNDNLFGRQRIFEIFDKNILVNRLNIDLTAWCRHPEIETIFNKLNQFTSHPVSENGT